MTLPTTLPRASGLQVPGRIRRWLFLAALAAACAHVLVHHFHALDGWDIAILLGSAAGLALLGMAWAPLRMLSGLSAAAALAAVALYGGDIGQADRRFLLKYFLASQSAIMWMGLCYWGAFALYAIGWVRACETWLRRGSLAAWLGTLAGTAALLVRWHESYLLGPEIGHIPVSNLYEVFVLFCVLTALLYLHMEDRQGKRQLGAFALAPVCAAVLFIFSYGYGAHEIQPLIPALKSYWMKLHVPANFIGYGAFSIAAMVGAAWLAAERPYFARRLPERAWLEELAYKAIALGFVFFTIATILGALWAAEAWGGYWSWDPKETWALVVWLNYAAWLHARLVKHLRGAVLAWWAVAGFFITLFAFVGVNMFLAGLHSYGSL